MNIIYIIAYNYHNCLIIVGNCLLVVTAVNRDCGCQDWHGCIMRSSVIGDEGIQPYKFSTCSRKQFNSWMGDGHALCLLNYPNQLPKYTDNGNCGNGIIDDGEECDCAAIDCGAEGCCNGATCRLKPEAAPVEPN